MRQGLQAFRVGLLVITCTVIFGGLVLFIIGSGFSSDRRHYRLLFSENVKGMVVGSKVNYMGIPVGAVSDIRFQGGHTLVDVSVDPKKAVVQKVTRARLDRLLVTGQVTVELEGYQAGAETLPDGAMVETKGNPLSKLSSNLPDLLSKLDRVLSHADALMSEGNRQHVAHILANLDAASERLPSATEDLMQDLRGLVAEFRPVAASADKTLRGVENGVERVAEMIDSAEMHAALSAAQGSMQQLADVEGSLLSLSLEAHNLLTNNKHPLRNALLTLRDTMREFQGLARKLRMAPSSLLFGVEEAELTVPASMPPGGRR